MSESSLKKKRTTKQQGAEEGHVWVWGDNSLGQLLDLPTCDEVVAPRLVEKHLMLALRGGWDELRRAPGDDCVEAAQGNGHFLLLSENGEVRGGGRSFEGQLSQIGVMVHATIPIAIAEGIRVVSVACGGRHSALLAETGLFTFGSNSFGQLGHSGGVLVVPTPTMVGDLWHCSVAQVSLGGEHSACVTASGRVFIWGCNTANQCGVDGFVQAPVESVTLDAAREVSCGSEHTLVLLRSGQIRQFGGVFLENSPSRVISVAAGFSHSAAVLDSGSVVCWGDASRGATNSRGVHRVSKVLCGRHWTAAFSPSRAVAAAAPAVLTPSTPVLGALGAFASLEQLEPTLLSLRVGAQTTRALMPLVARALAHGSSHPKERHLLGLAVLRAGGTSAGSSEVEQVAALLHDCDALAGVVEDSANRHWTGASQTALSEHLLKTRSISRALTMPLLHFVALLRAAAAANSPATRFYNDVVSRRLDVPLDYERWTRGLPSVCGNFSWLLLPFAKAAVLQEEARISMDQMYADAVVREMLGRPATSPFLEMVVRRDHLISDTLERLADLETRNSTRAFRKKLKVTFEGEQGLDEGGVTKEYFLLLVRQLFQPEYALVTWDENKTICWFSPAALENESEFKLVGIVFGLAIYNSTILDVHFPPVIYSYLLNPEYIPTFEDLKSAFPAVAQGLQQLLDFPDNNIEDVFCLNFAVATEHFGCVTTHPLIENGENIAVTRENRQQYVDLYTRFLLLDSVAASLKAFIGGFSLLAKRDGFLQHLLPQELERIVCGYPHWNLAELQRVTTYEGGYTSETPVVVWFWEIVSAMPTTEQHKLLSFATGSDRVPVGGFSEMEFVIQRQGEDSEALPTSHTCFNVLLLPEYSSKEKLQHKLEFAVLQTEGFMLI